MYDFTNYYHFQLARVQVCVNKTLAHPLCNLNSLYLTWFQSFHALNIVQLIILLLFNSGKSSNIRGACLLLENTPVVQEYNILEDGSSLSLYLWEADYFIWSQNSSLLERGADNLPCCLQLRIRWLRTMVSFLFGNAGLGQHPCGLLNILGLCPWPSPQQFARFPVPS